MTRPLKTYLLILAIGSAALVTATGGAQAAAAKTGWLGITMQAVSESIADAMDLDDGSGVLVSSVVEDSPADEAGIQDGDIITAYDGQEIEDGGDLARLVGKTEPGKKVEITILRDGEQKRLKVEIGEREKDWPGIAAEKGKSFQWIPKGEGNDDDDVYFFGTPDDESHRINIKKMTGDHGYMGVSLQDLSEQLGEYFGVENGQGALVKEVFEDTPAAEAGLKAGDVIVKIDGQNVESPADLTEHLSDKDEGDEITLELVRNKTSQTVKLTLADAPDTFEWQGGEALNLRMPKLPKTPNMPKMWQYYHQTPSKEWRQKNAPFQDERMQDLRKEMDELRREMKELRRQLKRELGQTKDKS
jgi:serine protease Do